MKEKRNFERLTHLFKTLADENRLRILYVLKEKEISVGELVTKLELSQPLVSHHLRELKLAGLVTSRKSGPYVFYRLKKPQIFELISLAQSLAGGKE